MAAAVPRSETDEAESLARGVSDPDRLLPGEEPGTPDLEVARRWLETHGQLLELRLELERDLQRGLERVRDPAVGDGLRLNARGLALAIQRSRARLWYWERRVEELTGRLAAAARP